MASSEILAIPVEALKLDADSLARLRAMALAEPTRKYRVSLSISVFLKADLNASSPCMAARLAEATSGGQDLHFVGPLHAYRVEQLIPDERKPGLWKWVEVREW